MTDMYDVFNQSDAAADYIKEGWRLSGMAGRKLTDVGNALAALLSTIQAIDVGHVHQEAKSLSELAYAAGNNYKDADEELDDMGSPNLLVDSVRASLALAHDAIGNPEAPSLATTADVISKELGDIQQALGGLAEQIILLRMRTEIAEPFVADGRNLGTQALERLENYRSLLD